jgi:hypothetical protein
MIEMNLVTLKAQLSTNLNLITFLLFSFHVLNENDQLEHVYLNSLLMKHWTMFAL